MNGAAAGFAEIGKAVSQFTGSRNSRPQTLAQDLNWAEEAQLQAYYEQEIQPYAEEFEQRRQDSIRTTGYAATIVIPIAVTLMSLVAILCTLFLPDHPDGKNIPIFACFVIAFISWKLLSKPINTFKGNVKAEIFPKIFAYFGETFSYREKCPIGTKDLEWSGIVPSHDNAWLEDYVKGEHQGVGIELLEAKLTEQRGGGKSRRTVTVFDGICIVLDMNKSFSGKTIIKRDAGKLGNWFKGVFNALDRVALEDPVFEKKFEVYSSDQVEARYLLSTTFMERLMELQRLYGGTSIEASFHEDKLLLMIACKHNHFQASSIWDESTFLAETKTIVREMRSIFRIIDVLRLNVRNGL